MILRIVTTTTMEQVQSTRRASKIRIHQTKERRLTTYSSLLGAPSSSRSPPLLAVARLCLQIGRHAAADREKTLCGPGRWPRPNQLALARLATSPTPPFFIIKLEFFKLTSNILVFFWVSKGHPCKNFGCPRGHPIQDLDVYGHLWR